MLNKKMLGNENRVVKTLLSTCMFMGYITSGAQAVELYNDKGLVYQIKADWQVQLKRDLGNDQNLDLEYDDLELKNSIAYDLGNGVKAIGQLDLSYNTAADNEVRDGSNRLEEAYLGFKTDNHRIIFGKTNTAGDEFGVEKAFEKVGLAEDGFEEIADSGDDLIRADLHFGNIYVATSIELEAEGEGAAADPSLIDLFVSYEVGNIILGAAYMDFQSGPTAESIEVTGISASLGSYGIDFSSVDRPAGGEDLDIMNIVAGFNLTPAYRLRLGLVDEDSSINANDASGWYTNLIYKFASQKNVRLFAEIGDNDKANTDLSYLVGMQIKI